MSQPLPDRVRPNTLDGVLGQERWLGPEGALRIAVERDAIVSTIFWGPPGCGKTTIARALAAECEGLFLQLSAVLDGVKELRRILDRARTARELEQRRCFVFVDEIHRWNKAQQDALLPHVEGGDIVLLGATTENPSFSLIPALRSRVQIIRLDPLADEVVEQLLRSALEACDLHEVTFHPDALGALARSAAGDARRALNDLDRVLSLAPAGHEVDRETMIRLVGRSDLRHDRSGDDHYDVVSAFIKSMRGSDPDAAIYWLARLIAAGEDPRFIARRLVIFAAEDVGNADPRGLEVAVAAAHAVQLVGMPEGRIPLAQATTWLATCPKSNASYLAIDAALAEVKRSGAQSVPLPLRNTTSRATNDAEYGRGYRYPHDHPHAVVRQQYLPDTLVGRHFYTPTRYGAEKLIGERLDWWRRKLQEDS